MIGALRPATAAAVAAATAFSAPQQLTAGTYSTSVTLDASRYTVDHQTAAGFDLVRVEGLELSGAEGPMLPATELRLPLPADAQVTGVVVQRSGEVNLGVLRIPSYEPGVPLAGSSVPERWVATPASVGVVPAQGAVVDARRTDGYKVAHVHVVPVRYDAASGQSSLAGTVTATVSYTSEVPVAITSLDAPPLPTAPGQSLAASAVILNASDQPAALTTETAFVDMAGAELGTTAGSAFSVPAGSTSTITTTAPAPGQEGSYELHVRVLRGGVVVAQATTPVQVVSGHIKETEGPVWVSRGDTATFTVTYASYQATDRNVAIAVRIDGEDDVPVASLEPVLGVVPASGELQASFRWVTTRVPPGRYRVRVSATPEGGVARTAAREVSVVQRVRRHLEETAP